MTEPAKRPSAQARAARCWLASAYAIGCLGVDGPGTAIGTHGRARHHLDAAPNSQFRLPRHHFGSSEVHGIEARGAIAVQLHARYGLVEAGVQRSDAGDVATLLADRRHTAQYHFFH